jgi:hypothetical protein
MTNIALEDRVTAALRSWSEDDSDDRERAYPFLGGLELLRIRARHHGSYRIDKHGAEVRQGEFKMVRVASLEAGFEVGKVFKGAKLAPGWAVVVERSWTPGDAYLRAVKRGSIDALFGHAFPQRKGVLVSVSKSGTTGPPSVIPVPPMAASSHGLQLLRVGGAVGLALIFASIGLLLVSVGLAMVGMYAGLSIFALSNYASYRVGQQYIIGPSMAPLVTFVSGALAVVALTGVILK